MQPAEPFQAASLDTLGLTHLHLLAVGVCAFGFSFDLLEIALGNVLSAVYSIGPQRAGSGELALLLASVYLGAIPGAPLFGWLADRHGRRLVLAGLMAWLAVCSVGAALAAQVGVLSAWRCAGGLALGAFPPLMFAYLTDLMPAGRRGPAIMVAIALASLGPVVGIFLVRQIGDVQPFGLAGWRWAFLAGGAGTLATALLFLALPESPRWLAACGRHAAARSALARLTRSPVLLSALAPAAAVADQGQANSRRRLSVMALLYFLAPWSTVAFPVLSGAVLLQKGFKLDDTLLVVGLSSFGPLLGNLAAAFGVDRLGRRAAMASIALVMLAASALFIASAQPSWVLAGSLVFNVAGFLYLSVLNLYCGEQFQTARRAGAMAACWALNRTGAALAPLLLVPLLRASGPAAMFVVIAASLAAMLALLALAPPGPPKRSAA